METNKTFEIGGIDYILKHSEIYILYLCIYALGLFIGFFGNVLIMASIIITKELHNTTYMLIFNLSIADLVVSTYVDSTTIVAALVGKTEYTRHYPLCDITAAICLISCSVVTLSIGFLAFNRYLLICHRKLYVKVFTTRNTLIFCIISWFVGVIVDLPSILGWGGHAYSDELLSCAWDRKANRGFTIFFPITAIMIPSICVFVFYLKIYLFLRESKKRTQTTNTRNSSKSKVSKSLFVSFLFYVLSYVPYGILVLADWNFKYPVAEIFAAAFFHMNSSANPIVYGIFNYSFRQGYMNVLNMILRRRQRNVHQSTNKKSKAISVI